MSDSGDNPPREREDVNDNDSISGELPSVGMPGLDGRDMTLERMFTLMLSENRRRDEMMERVLSNQQSRLRTSDEETFQVMPDLTRNVQVFDGNGDANGWVKKLESMQILHHWPDSFAIEIARSNLKGGAYQWWLSRQDQITSFQSFVDFFKKTYVVQEGLPQKWKKMSEKIQRRGDTVNDYIHEKYRLCQDLRLSFPETKEQILIGLFDRQLYTTMLAKSHFDIDSLIHDLLEYERIERTRIERLKKEGIIRKPDQTVWQNSRKREEKPIKVERRLPERNEEGKPLCFNCQKYGHTSKYCQSPKRVFTCFTCKEEGHTSKNCKKNPVEKTVTEQTKTTATQLLVHENENKNKGEKAVEKYIKEIQVKEKKLHALVDPGSAVCTIKENIVFQENLTCKPVTYKLYGFGSDSGIEVNWKTELEIKIDDIETKVELFVVPNEAQPIDVLLGRSFTEQQGVAYVKLGDKLYFGNENDNPFKNMMIEQKLSRVPVTVTADTTLFKNHVNYVQVKIGKEETILPVAYLEGEDLKIKKGDQIGEVRGEEKKPDETKYPALERSSNSGEKIPITLDMLKINTNLNDFDSKRLLNLINEYRGCFAVTIEELGCTDLLTVKIRDNDSPVRAKPYRVSNNDRQTIKEIVKKWRENGIVRDTNSPYASPVLLVPKASGEKRLVIDFRRLNKQTVKNNFPIPNLEDCFEMLSGCTIFCTLDLMNGYLQVPLSEESKQKTAFITPDETAEFQRLCFGLVNAPYEFSKLMSIVLGSLKDKMVVSFLDDILVPARDVEHMLELLKLVFQALEKANLTLNVQKCEFAKTSVNYLGYELSGEGLKPGSRKLQAVEEFPRPVNKHETRRYLGLTGFFRKFVPKYALIARPLTDLTKANKEFIWGEQEENSFLELKEKLLKAPVLQLFNSKAYTELHCDASSQGIAGLLLQRGDDEKLHLVQAVSKKTNDAEKKYHSSKLELLAIVYCVERLRYILLGIKFVVVSDCQALVYLNAKKTLNPQIARWYAFLNEYDMEIKYRPGEKMSHVDSLSRAAVENPSEIGMMDDIYDKRIDLLVPEEDRMLMIQRSDPRLCTIVEILKKEEYDMTNEEKNQVKDYLLETGRLYKKVKVNHEEDIEQSEESENEFDVPEIDEPKKHSEIDSNEESQEEEWKPEEDYEEETQRKDKPTRTRKLPKKFDDYEIHL